ncbi:hypothetical protein GH714_023090 [Hevea brasiliensis]|uniref:Uncharacterized protein n=1 Tax=Hevea brasiliensis TaxID=3981 RepID=A0A6A6LA89_HEVBR|nr:hypothetical protein GH714_023090 [Hevea brasiliensis]
MTSSCRYYPDPPMEKDDVRGKAKLLAKEDTDEEDDQVLRQLKRTQANVTVWELLLTSEKHRTAPTKALSVLKVFTEKTLEEIAKVVLIEDGGHITFSNHDVPAEGRNHSRALFATVEVRGWKVPCVMIDDGSAINVCPSKILPKLEISMSELTGSDLVIRAYDDSKRNMIGVFKTMVKVGLVETKVEFTVLDIPMTFSLLLVTGANKGIGFSLVKRLAESGLTVILTARDVERGYKAIEQLRNEHGDGDDLHLHFYRLDVSDPASIKAFVSQFEKDFGVLDILVNNAAVSFNEIHENSVEHAETVVKTNFYGPKLLIEALLPMFRQSTSACSRILNITSRLGSINKMRNPKMKEMLLSENLSEEQIVGMVNLFIENVKKGTWKSQGWPEIWTDYAVSKLALNVYSRVLATRYKDCGLRVNCFCPGFTQTSMTRGKGTHTAADAAEVGARLALLPPHQLPTGKFYIGFSPGIVSKL